MSAFKSLTPQQREEMERLFRKAKWSDLSPDEKRYLLPSAERHACFIRLEALAGFEKARKAINTKEAYLEWRETGNKAKIENLAFLCFTIENLKHEIDQLTAGGPIPTPKKSMVAAFSSERRRYPGDKWLYSFFFWHSNNIPSARYEL